MRVSSSVRQGASALSSFRCGGASLHRAGAYQHKRHSAAGVNGRVAPLRLQRHGGQRRRNGRNRRRACSSEKEKANRKMKAGVARGERAEGSEGRRNRHPVMDGGALPCQSIVLSRTSLRRLSRFARISRRLGAHNKRNSKQKQRQRRKKTTAKLAKRRQALSASAETNAQA